MLRILTRTMRRRAGRLLALAYFVCVIAPPVALTFADGAAAAHCLNEDHHIAATVHAHGDAAAYEHGAMHDHATMHDHADHGAPPPSGQEPSDGKRIPANCCGMFCVNGATYEVSAPALPYPRARVLPSALESAIGGLVPSRIDRPPIIFVSL